MSPQNDLIEISVKELILKHILMESQIQTLFAFIAQMISDKTDNTFENCLGKMISTSNTLIQEEVLKNPLFKDELNKGLTNLLMDIPGVSLSNKSEEQD